MAAIISGGALPRYLCRLCGDLALPAPLPAVGTAPDRNLMQLVAGPREKVELGFDVVVCRRSIQPGRQPLHQPTARHSDQFPLHRTPLPQLDCA